LIYKFNSSRLPFTAHNSYIPYLVMNTTYLRVRPVCLWWRLQFKGKVNYNLCKWCAESFEQTHSIACNCRLLKWSSTCLRWYDYPHKLRCCSNWTEITYIQAKLISIRNPTAIHTWTAKATRNKQLQPSVLYTHGQLELQGTSNISHHIYSIRDHSSQQGHHSIEHHVDGQGSQQVWNRNSYKGAWQEELSASFSACIPFYIPLSRPLCYDIMTSHYLFLHAFASAISILCLVN